MHVRIRISFYSKQRKNYFIKYPPTLIELLPIFQVTGQHYGILLCSAEVVLALSGVASLTKLCPGSLSACSFFVKVLVVLITGLEKDLIEPLLHHIFSHQKMVKILTSSLLS